MAAQGTVSVKAFLEIISFEEVAAATIAAAAAGLAAIPALAKVAYIQVEGGDVKYRDDGVAPTSTVGMRLPDTGTLEYTGKLSNIQFIKSSGTPKLNVSYYK